MRITTRMIANNLIARLAQTSEQIYRLQSQVASGKRVLRPSDDPTAAARARALRSDLAQIARFTENASYATNLLSDLDGSLDAIYDTVREACDIALQAGVPTLADNQPDALAAMVDELIERLVSLGNTQREGRYVFAGHSTLEEPFSLDASASPPVEYAGDSGLVRIEVSQGDTVVANVTGDELFNMDGAADPALDDLFTTLSLLRDEIRAGDTDAVSARLEDMDAHLSRLLELRAEVGGRINRLELCTDRLADMKVSLTEMRSEVEDADLVQTVVDLETQENIYQATAAAAARIGQLSLLDFLR